VTGLVSANSVWDRFRYKCGLNASYAGGIIPIVPLQEQIGRRRYE